MKGFVSYSHDDQRACIEMCKHLRVIERAYGVDFYTDHRNRTGQDFEARIRTAIADAGIHVVLVSHNMLWSDWVMDTELPLIREKHRIHGDLVLYVVIDGCAWETVPGALLVSPRDRSLRVLPVKRWPTHNDGYDAARMQIEAAIKDHLGVPVKRASGGAA